MHYTVMIAAETEEEIREKLDPFSEHSSESGMWDWYVLGGRWSNFFILKNGEHDFQAKKSEIDFDKIRQKREDIVLKKFDEFSDIWGSNRIPKLGSFDSENRKHPIIQKIFKRAREKNMFYIDIDSEFCGGDREKTKEFARMTAIRPYAFIDSDGKWHESPRSPAEDDFLYSREINDWIDTLADDTVLTIVDCHT